MKIRFGGYVQRLALTSLCAFVLISTSGCGAFRGFERSMSTVIFPASTEAALGQQYAEQVEGEFSFVDDPESNQWLDEMGYSLVENSPPTKQEFNFAITTSPEVNAFAIPGGYCYVNLGLILYADNEAQVAAVVGHEINHVVGRHGILQAQRGMGLGIITTLVAGQFRSPVARAAAMIAGQGGGFLAMRDFGRDDEREADEWGVEAMYKAGYDPRAAARFFEKLHELAEGNDPSLLEQLISTHPPTEERIQNIRAQIQRYDLTVPLVLNTPEFDRVKGTMQRIYDSGGAASPAAIPSPNEE